MKENVNAHLSFTGFVNCRSDEAMWSSLIILLLLTSMVVELLGENCQTLGEMCTDPACAMSYEWCAGIPIACANCHGGG